MIFVIVGFLSALAAGGRIWSVVLAGVRLAGRWEVRGYLALHCDAAVSHLAVLFVAQRSSWSIGYPLCSPSGVLLS
jgi:hypothetical protein